jgi:cobalt-zinc-cadmium efflux system membrane fusion protein
MATLSSVGKTIDPDSRAIRCIAKIDSRINQNLINQSYIEATIVLDSQQAKALPSDAILKSGSDYFVFVIRKSDNQNYYLQKEQVKIGRVSDKFTEIIEGESLQKVVIRGVYNLPTE